jgi:hypothetical protein
MLRQVVQRLPSLHNRFFTLLHYCPTIYWEHGGSDDVEIEETIRRIWQMEEDELNLTQQYFDRMIAILREAGVPMSHIYTRTAIQGNNVVDATLSELRRDTYSGVILSSDHRDIIDRLQSRGLAALLRWTPPVAIWAIDTAEAGEADDQLNAAAGG